MPEALIFDLDGVLVDSRANVERHWTAWARSRGVDPEAALALVHLQRSVDTIRAVAPDIEAEAEADALDRNQAADTAGVVAAPGARELLADLRGTPWAVVTSCSRELAERRLAAAGLPQPPAIVGAEAVRRGKPHPEGLLRAAEALGVAASECTVLEDAPTGVAAARAAGMHVVAIATTHEPVQLADADACVGTLREAAALLELSAAPR